MTGSGSESSVDIFQKFLDSRLADVHTAIPGKILSYDESKGLAKVLPLVSLKRKVNDTLLDIEIPPIENVPVMTLCTAAFQLKTPLDKGDQGMILFSEVGIGNFLNGSGDVVEADDISRFSLTDAFFIPGIWAPGPRPTNPTTIEVTKTGEIKMLGATESFVKGDTLETILSAFLQVLSAIVPGDQVANATALTAIKTAAATLNEQLSTMKSLKIKGE